MGFYNEMAGVASDVLGEFKQDQDGSVPIYLVRASAVTQGANAYDRPSRGTPTRTELDATAVVISTVSDKATKAYVDGKTIVGSDLVVTSAVFGSEPLMTDMIEVNGKLRKMKKISQIPAAGTPVVWKFIVEG